MLFLCLPRGGSCRSLGPHFWVYSSTGRCQKFSHSATLHSPMGCVTKSTLPSHRYVFLSYPETNVIGNKKSSPTLGAEVGNNICTRLSLSFVFIHVWVFKHYPSSWGPEDRTQATERWALSQQSLAGQCRYHPAPVFSAKGKKAELPRALLPAFCYLQQSCRLSDS